MNWIIHKSKKMPSHTYLSEVLKPLNDHIEDYNWVLSDIDGGNLDGLPIDYDHDYFVLSPIEFKKILNSRFQFYWGSILAIPLHITIKIDEDNPPYVEGNNLIWKNGNIQYSGAEIEIDCVDSGYTIVKFSREDLSNKFKTYFDEAIDLEDFK
ncbi:MAG: hypothetical protein ACHQHN_02545 [Sphingobacteriales bacterium]